MPLAEFLADLDQLSREAQSAFDSAGDAAALEAVRIDFLGMKSGRIKSAQKGLGTIDRTDKPRAGQRFNEVRQHLDAALEAAQARLASGATATTTSPIFDPTVPGIRPRIGHLHPLTQTIEELKDLMGRLGFTAVDGPEVEDERHNFEAAEHPGGTSGRGIRWIIFIWPSRTGCKRGRRGKGERGRRKVSPRLPLSASPPLLYSSAAKPAPCKSASWKPRRRRCGSYRWAASTALTTPTPRTTRCFIRSRACSSIAA